MSKQLREDLQTPHSRGRRNWFPLMVLALGGAALLLFASTEWIHARFQVGAEQVLALNKIQTKISISHLWVEEYVTGDTVDLDEIRGNLAESEVLLHGIETQMLESQQLLNTSELVTAGKSVAGALSELTHFAVVTQQRIEGVDAAEEVGIGSTIDTQFDAIFAAILANLITLESIYQTAFDRTEARARVLVRAIVIAWLLIVAVAVGGLWHRERRRAEAVYALIDSESRLLQSQKMDAVGRLAGGIAHDINNHLAAMTMQCEVVKLRASPGDPIIERMDAITAIGAKSAALIRRLLAFSRRQPVQPQVFSLKRIVVGMEKMLARLIGDDIRLRVLCGDDIWNVMMDPSQLEQVLLNLVINARDAMPAGGEISVFVENRSIKEIPGGQNSNSPGDYVVLTVSDQGSGIPTDVVDKVFEPYFTTKDISTSSGLGLAIVHGIVTQNRGYISLNSKEGCGTTFEILLPRSEYAEPEKATRPALGAPQAIESTRILVAEDNAELRLATCEILGELGYKVWSASDGEQALQIFDTIDTPFNLVITDVVMPAINGKKLADQMRARQPELSIIFVSGYTDDVILRHGVEAGDVDFLTKPFTATDLAKTVQAVLSRAGNSQRHRTVISF